MACFIAVQCTDKNQGIFSFTSSSQSLVPKLAKSSPAKWSSDSILKLCVTVFNTWSRSLPYWARCLTPHRHVSSILFVELRPKPNSTSPNKYYCDNILPIY